jgi:hypothetical protein
MRSASAADVHPPNIIVPGTILDTTSRERPRRWVLPSLFDADKGSSDKYRLEKTRDLTAGRCLVG